jgi:hypothetical protein
MIWVLLREVSFIYYMLQVIRLVRKTSLEGEVRWVMMEEESKGKWCRRMADWQSYDGKKNTREQGEDTGKRISKRKDKNKSRIRESRRWEVQLELAEVEMRYWGFVVESVFARTSWVICLGWVSANFEGLVGDIRI